MGYAVGPEEIRKKTKQGMFEVSSPVIIPYYENNDTTPYTIWKVTIDLTNIDTLLLTGKLKSEAGASTAYCYLYQDTTARITLSTTSGAFDWQANTWDCSAVNEETTLYIKVATANAGFKAYLENVTLIPQSD